MKKRITLQEALKNWRSTVTSEEGLGRHIPSSELYEFLIQPSASEIKDTSLNHLCRCPLCIQELKDLTASIEEAEVWDLALPRAAASEEIEWPMKIPTEGGKYTIIIRPNISDRSKGVVTVKVELTYRDTLEGKKVILKDGRGQILLSGVIIDGQISQDIEELDAILPRFVVEPQ